MWIGCHNGAPLTPPLPDGSPINVEAERSKMSHRPTWDAVTVCLDPLDHLLFSPYWDGVTAFHDGQEWIEDCGGPPLLATGQESTVTIMGSRFLSDTGL